MIIHNGVKYFPDPCPTGEHKGGICCHACDHDYPVRCNCSEIPDDYLTALEADAPQGEK